MVIEKDTILYFTGTGNSLQVAKDISSELEGMELCSIAALADEKEIEVKAKRLGIVFPLYFACMPLMVEKAVKKLKLDKDTYVFAVSTRGGSPCAVMELINNILQEKGRKLGSGFLINMPGNYIVKYGAFPKRMQNRILTKEKKMVKKIASIVGKREEGEYGFSKWFFARTLTNKMHKDIERIHAKDKEFWTTDKCNGCGTCVKVCPVKNIELKDNKPVWKHNCEQCVACIQWCPKEAIQYGNKTLNRARYRNPNVKVSDIISSSANNK